VNQLRFFLRSKQFKKALTIIAIVLALGVLAGLIGRYMAPQAGIVGSVVAPFQKLAYTISAAISEFGENFKSAAILNAEKEKLQSQVNALQEQLVEYEQAANENKFYEDYLEIKENNPDFIFHPAQVISKDPDDVFGGFVLSAGSLDGLALYDPVITDQGLVGYISEISYTNAKVTTVLDPNLVCGAFDSRTADAGVVSGTTEFAANGQTRFYNLPRTCSIAVGDLVVTSGSGIFPDNLIIGTVNNISNDPLSSSLYATVVPTVNFEELKNVMVITSFAGQGNELID
jgi:rod shape-determining protein MreC